MSFGTKNLSPQSYNGWQQNGNNINNNNNNIIYDAADKQEKKKNESNGLREKLQINEFKFSLLLFTFSLSIVIGKLIINYGEVLQWQIDGNYLEKLPTLPAFPVINVTKLSNGLKPRIKFSGDRLMAAGENLINVSQKYEEAVFNTIVKISTTNLDWIRAAFGGIVTMGFTWYIIYKDSSVPGVDPPSPLSSLKKRGHTQFSMQINYFVGVLNGILIFVYLTL